MDRTMTLNLDEYVIIIIIIIMLLTFSRNLIMGFYTGTNKLLRFTRIYEIKPVITAI